VEFLAKFGNSPLGAKLLFFMAALVASWMLFRLLGMRRYWSWQIGVVAGTVAMGAAPLLALPNSTTHAEAFQAFGLSLAFAALQVWLAIKLVQWLAVKLRLRNRRG
jgi:hypothetical protein